MNKKLGCKTDTIKYTEEKKSLHNIDLGDIFEDSSSKAREYIQLWNTSK